MTLSELFVVCQQTGVLNIKKIVLCHWETQQGFEINNLDEFEQMLHEFDNDQVYLINEVENDNLHFFEYFIMNATQPYVVAIRHPLMTNAYWKDLPDALMDSFASASGGIYRYLMIDYGKHIKEYTIEFPPEIDTEILNLCAQKMRKSFRTRVNTLASNISLLFTNSSRFIDLNARNFVIYELAALYPDWNVKKITTLNLSRKLWNEMKQLGKT